MRLRKPNRIRLPLLKQEIPHRIELVGHSRGTLRIIQYAYSGTALLSNGSHTGDKI